MNVPNHLADGWPESRERPLTVVADHNKLTSREISGAEAMNGQLKG